MYEDSSIIGSRGHGKVMGSRGLELPPERHAVMRVALLMGAICLLLVAGGGTAWAQLPPGWTDSDIGGPGIAGSGSYSAGTWTVAGGGSDIWNAADLFNFAYQNTTNNVIIARVLSVQNTDPWAKAGVMFRDSSDPAAVFADVVITPGNGVNFQWRNAYAGQCGYSQVGGIFAPIWVKLVRANNQFTAYYGPDGVSWTPIGSSPTFIMNSPQLAGLCVTAHNNAALNTSTFSGVSLSYIAPAPPPPPPTFGVYRELWTGINGGLDTLTNTSQNPNWPNNPNSAYTKTYTNFEADANTGMNYYGQRMRTFVIPPTNGNYTFWISSDDNSELFLSTDETEANKVPVASVPGWTNPREWTKYPNQQSSPIFLEGGRRYYMEAIMQQGTGGDNLAVRWQLPDFTFEEPMTAVSPKGTLLVTCTGVASRPGIYSQTTNVTVIEGQNAFMSVLVTNQSPVTYQWRVGGVNIPGTNAQKPFYTITNASIAGNNGQVYTCGVTNSAGGILSSSITVSVLRDTTPPAVQRTINVGTTSVQVVYTKVVEAASATNTANYHFTNSLAISSAALGADNMTVTLTTAPLVYGSNYTILISNVRDRASIPNTIAPNTPASFTASPYTLQDIGNPSIPTVTTFVTNGLNVVASGTDIGGQSDQFGLNYQPRTGDFDLAVRLQGLSLSDVWAKAGLMARETLDPGARFAAALTTPSMAGSFFEWRDPAYSEASMAGRFPGNYPNGWLRLQRSGNTFTGFASYDGQTWTPLGSSTISMPAQIYVGLVVSSHSGSQTATALFRDVTDSTGDAVATVLNPHEPLGPCSRLSPIVVSEIMYKPAPRTDTNNVEFIELYNSNPYFEDISGFQIAGGSISYTIPPGTVLPGGGFLVVAASPASIQAVYGINNVLGPYVGSLKKSGKIQLVDDLGAILLTIPYSNVSPWPAGADGTGHSLVLANPTYGEGNPLAWDISDVVGGSPGTAEAYRPSPLRNVVINEFLAHTDPPEYDYIELYNHANSPVDVSGCILTDDPTTNKFFIPPGTIIPARGFVWYSETNMNFRLNKLGETIYFKSADQSRFLDAVSFEGQENGVSMGRWPDGANDWYRLTALTPGTNNGSIRLSSVVLNELMYKPISGNDDDQYIELYNRATTNVDLSLWQLGNAASFTFPSNTVMTPGSYLVIARNAAHLRTNYPNLNTANCLGDYTGKLSHKGERLTLAMPHYTPVTNGNQVTYQIDMYIVVNEVTYSVGGRWGQWARGGGSSLELKDPNSNNRLAYNWTDSNETGKSVWTNIEFTGILDNGANFNGTNIDLVQLGLLDVGECLVDNVEVRPGGTGGPNIIANSGFESGLNGWIVQGDHIRSSLETASGLGGYSSFQSVHLRSDDGVWTLADSVQGSLTQSNMTSGQTATLRLKARWLRGSHEILMRLRGNWLEVTGSMPVPVNLGTPGLPNSCLVTNAGPAIYEVKHSPPLPVANQAVVVAARFHDASSFTPTLLYRVDTGVNPTPSYTSVPMVDDGTGGDLIAGDGLYSATIPAQPQGTVVAFLVQATDAFGATTIFPADLQDHSGLPRECVVGFGDPIPTGSFSHHHVFITQNWANQWAVLAGVSHELNDGTWVDGGGRIVYDWTGRYAGSPYHQYTGSPVTTVGGMHWIVPEDDQVFGTASLNKQHVPGNGPLDDNTLQREQTSYWMAHQIGLQRNTRRYYFYYVNGNRHGPLMEDSQVPGQEMINQHWPTDNNGWLFKNHAWFEGDVAQDSNGYMNFNNMSWCSLGRYTTTINGVPNQYKQERYRWVWWIRQYPVSANDFSQVYALIDAANTPTTSPAYYQNMEAQVDTEEWVRWAAVEHATGDWDSFFTQNMWNMYNYKPTLGKWTALKWDWNITLGSGTQTWPPDGSQLFNFGASDPVMGAFLNYPAYFRAYLRALQDIANLAMNNSLVDPVLDSRYSAFVANGLTSTSAYGLLVQEPGAAGLKSWIGTMHNSILTALANQGVTGVPFAVTSSTVSNDVVIVSGTAPIAVKTIWFNGIAYPVFWNSVTGWTVTVPLLPGTNNFNVVGVDLHNQPVPGSTATVSAVYNNSLPSPMGKVVINEVMFNPAIAGAQYIELYNSSSTVTFDLSNWQLQGVGYTFPGGSYIAPNSYLLLTADPSAFAQAYGGLIPVFDTFPGGLSTTGERLLLVQPVTNSTTGLIVAGLTYKGNPPWPSGANGTGSSLQLIDSHQDNWRAGNWAVSSINPLATPGSANSTVASLAPFPSLWINELQADNLTGITNSAGQHTAWLEIYNPTTSAISLTNIYLANNYTNLLQWRFPNGAVVNPGQFKIVFADGQTGLSTLNELHTSFVLSSGAGSLALSRVTTNAQVQVLDYIDYTNLLADHSFGSFPDGQIFYRQQFFFATPGASNNAVVPASFISYTSAGSVYSQNFDSLPNPGPTSVNTANPVTIDGITYSLANPFDFALPSQASGNNGGLGLPSLAGWYGRANLTAKFGATDGDQTTGGVLSFGLPSSSNRAVGLLATSSTGGTAFGAKFINETPVALSTINLQVTGEIWRQSNLPKTLAFHYYIDPTATNSFPTNYTASLPSLNVSIPTVPADVGGAAVDGTSPANQVNLSVANQGITNWPPGAALWLVWDMTDPTGKAQGLAIDNLSFSAEPPFPILESAVSLDGPFTQELDAVVNPAQKTITTSIKSNTRFYRLSSQVATTILTIQVQNNQVTMTYQ